MDDDEQDKRNSEGRKSSIQLDQLKRNSGVSKLPAQNYEMSTTISPENILVVLNLLKMDTGEWVLTKSITQGLPNDTGQCNQAAQEEARFDEINGVLEKLQSHVDTVNCEIKTAKDTIEEQQNRCKQAQQKNCSSNSGGYSNMSRNCDQECFAFNEMSFVQQLSKMFTLMLAGNDNDACMCTTCKEGDENCTGAANAGDGKEDKTGEEIEANGESEASLLKKGKTESGQTMKENQLVGPDTAIPAGATGMQKRSSESQTTTKTEADDDGD